MLILPNRRVSQPQQAGGPDWGNPIARGMRLLWSAQAPHDLVTGSKAAAFNNAPASAHSAHGLGKVGAGNAALDFGKRLDLGTPGTDTISYMVVLHLVNAATADGYIMGRITFAGYPFSFQIDGAKNRFSAGVAGGLTEVHYPPTETLGQLAPIEGKTVVVLCTWNGATLSLSVQQLGGPWGGTSSVAKGGNFSSWGDTDDAPFFLFGSGIDWRLLNGANLLGAAVWNRALSTAESRDVLTNPWQLFQPLPHRQGWPRFQHSLRAVHSTYGAHCSLGAASQIHALPATRAAQRAASTGDALHQAHQLTALQAGHRLASGSASARSTHALGPGQALQRSFAIGGPVATTHRLDAVHAQQATHTQGGAVQGTHLLVRTLAAQPTATSPASCSQRHEPTPMPSGAGSASSTGTHQASHNPAAQHSAQHPRTSARSLVQSHPLPATAASSAPQACTSAAIGQHHRPQAHPCGQRHHASRASLQQTKLPQARPCAVLHRCAKAALPGFDVGPSRYLVHVPVLPTRVEAPDHIEFD